MQNLHIFDIVIVSLSVLLGLKGILRGFIKEVFALAGIVGGIFVGTRLAPEIGKEIAPILALENQATINIVGLIIGLVAFWAVLYVIGIIISKIFSASGLGIFDRIMGFIFGTAKIFLIFSITIFLLFQVNSFKSLLTKHVGGAVTFPILLDIGSNIAKIDFIELAKKVEEKVAPTKKEDVIEEDPDLIEKKSFSKEVSDTVKEIKQTTVQSGTIVVDTVKKAVNEKVEEIADSIKETSNLTQEELEKTEEAIKDEASKMTEEINKGN